MRYVLFASFLLFLCTNKTFGADKISPLVDIFWLKQNLDRDQLVILDVRPEKNYAKGHITGAVSAPYTIGWRKTIDGVVGMLPPRAEIVSHIRSLGIDNDEHVIILPHGKSSTDFGAATRIYWTFKVLGHDQVSILDGGYKAWSAGGGALSKTVPNIMPGSFTATFRTELLASEAEVKAQLGQTISMVDARPASQYNGFAKSPVVRKAGTLPNAVNFEQSKFYNAKKATFIDISRLENLSQSSGINKEQPIITFCNTGHWASIAWFAFSEIQGRGNIALYDGSMSEWTLNDDNAIMNAQ